MKHEDFLRKSDVIAELYRIELDYLDSQGLNGKDEMYDTLQRCYARVVRVCKEHIEKLHTERI